jgi:Ni,Fe-hydrogenase III large subunit/Ni,Fe-hydrogenase III component G
MKINRWFAEQLGLGGIQCRYLKEHLPEHMPCFQIKIQDWINATYLAKKLDMRFVAIWAAEESIDESPLYAYMAFAHPNHRHTLLRTELDENSPVLPSIADHYPAAMRMERTIQDMFGIKMDGLSDPRQWIRHDNPSGNEYPLRSAFKQEPETERTEYEYPFIKAEGDGVYEIPVGPVHAGIIEPGHFRFLAVGERILNMEERFGYLHRGIEKRIEGMTANEAAVLAGRISGDATVAHGWAFALACEYAAGLKAPERAVALRAILCERERMANHIGDIGAICNDAAFSFMHVQMQRLREDMARLHKSLFGHRLLMDLVTPGGVKCDLDITAVKLLAGQTWKIATEVQKLYGMYSDHSSIQDRVMGSGVVSHEDAKAAGLLGYAGRASGVNIDERVEEAYPPYDRFKVTVAEQKHGDVATRIWVRFEEIKESARLIGALLAELPDGKTSATWSPPRAGTAGFSVVESWRGEIACWVRFGDSGRIDRFMVRDPSVINWLGLELAVRNVPVPDFPLNNKSFNCSYAGNDL